jgi:hypothetical protein
MVLRGLCDYVLSGEANTYDVSYALVSVIDAIENTKSAPLGPDRIAH